MCGIVVLIAPDRGRKERLLVAGNMADRLAHRGPDDAGSWTADDAPVALAHRRLAVVGLGAEGHQPMLSPTGHWQLVYNGEIYNHHELRMKLEAEGARFRGTSDTEVLLAGIDRWGLKATLNKAVGMFALAAYHLPEKKLTIARDRFGEKPLYYGRLGADILVVSEMKACHAHPQWSGTVDRTALAGYFSNNVVPSPRCIYSGFEKLPPASLRSIVIGRSWGNIEYYWEPPPRDETPWESDKIATVIDRLDDSLHTAVSQQLEADVPVGAFLSGGVDSTLLVAIARKLGGKIRTFTIGFSEKAYDESRIAEKTAKSLATDHITRTFHPRELIRQIPCLASIYDEPFADSSHLPILLVSRHARRHVTASLSGDAGDELFIGYNRYHFALKWSNSFRLLPHNLRRGLGRLLRSIDAKTIDRLLSTMNHRTFSNPGDQIHKIGKVLSATNLTHLHRRLITEWSPHRIVIGLDSRDCPGFPDMKGPTIADMVISDIKHYLPDDILVKVDRAAMSTSLETRAPFLDHRVAEQALRIPIGVHMRDGKGKWILRQLLHRYLPERPTLPKTGFGVPLGDWLRGPLKAWAGNLLDRDRLRQSGLLQPEPIIDTWHQHQKRRANYFHRLWSVLIFQVWWEAQN